MDLKKTLTLEDVYKSNSPLAFSTMIKPAGSACNLDCAYCYYLDKAVLYGNNEPQMSDELLEIYIKQYIEANDVPQISFVWHGGEPLLLGVDFYKKAIALQKKYAAGKQIDNSLQTNGTLINDDWCKFFADNKFLIGISIDGPKDIHDAFRLNKGGQPTFDKAMHGLELLKKNNVEFNTLSVVNSLCANRGVEIYKFFKSIGSQYMQFLPAVEHVVNKENFHRPMIVSPETEGAQLAPWSISATKYGQFLIDIFDEWIMADVGKYYVQMFDATLANYCGVMPGVCSMCETCGDALVVEHNGDVFSCDHFVYPKYKLGNIETQSLRDIYNTKKRFAFGLDKRNSLPRECLHCKYYFACHGGCPKHRFEKSAKGNERLNSLCAGLKAYFAHTAPYMEYMRNLLAAQQPPSLVMRWAWEQKM